MIAESCVNMSDREETEKVRGGLFDLLVHRESVLQAQRNYGLIFLSLFAASQLVLIADITNKLDFDARLSLGWALIQISKTFLLFIVTFLMRTTKERFEETTTRHAIVIEGETASLNPESRTRMRDSLSNVRPALFKLTASDGVSANLLRKL